MKSELASQEVLNALELLRRAQRRLSRCRCSQAPRLGRAILEIEEILDIVSDPECEGLD
ncbi:hypothetical protein LJK88_38470 [Paenibacillus sp. P26]|nr:hypothetical protein LJK88_38470 [Paenibacillus sp. P26]